jgi:hypothetical protein
MPNILVLALTVVFFYKIFFCKKKIFRLPWQPEFFMKSNSLNNLGRASCIARNIPAKFQQIWQIALGGEVV